MAFEVSSEPPLGRFALQIACRAMVVADHHAGIAAHPSDAVELTANALPWQRGVHDRGQAFPAEVVDDAEHPEAATIPCPAGHCAAMSREGAGCLTRSPATIAGSAPAGSSWARSGSPGLACDRPVYGLLSLLPGRSGRASSSSPFSPLGPAGGAVADSRSYAVRWKAPLASLAVRCLQVWLIHADTHADRSRPGRKPAAGCSVSLSWPGPQRVALHRASEVFPSISLSMATSSICSANIFFSFAFSASSAFSRLASDTSMPPYFERHL